MSNIQLISERQITQATIINGYEIYEILGKGSFGQVFKAQKDGQIYALKLLDLKMIRQRNIEKFVANEINLMRKMNHKNVVKIYDAFQTPSVIFLVLEFCNQGTLLTHISKQRPNVEECMNLFIQILAGVRHIHENGVLHRDLKPENIFIHDGVLKIADFGLAQFEHDDFVYCGTSFYMAPEVLERRQVTYKSDLWSLGIVLFYMLFRRLPFYSKSNLLKIIKQWTEPYLNVRKYFAGNNRCLDLIDTNLDEFFKKVLVFDIHRRIAFKDLFNLIIIEKKMKHEEQKVSLIFYSNLDNCIERVNSPKHSLMDFQQDEQKKQQQNESNNSNSNNNTINKNEPVKINPQGSPKSTRLSTNVQIMVFSSQFDDIPDDDAPNLQSIYPTNNQTHFERRQSVKGPPAATTLDPNKIQITPSNFPKQRQSVSFLEQLNPKRFSYEDVLSHNIFSDFEAVQPPIITTKQEIYLSNQDIIQLCSQIKSSIHSFFTEDIPHEYQFEVSEIKSIVYKYQLLDDILTKLQDFRLGYSTQCLMNFIISKIILFIIHSAKQFLDRGLAGFQKLDLCKKIKAMLSNDLKSWENKMFVFINGIDLENDIKQENLKNIILGESGQFTNLKDVIQPFCIIIELLFSISYQLSQQDNNDKIRFKKYCFLLILIINIQSLFKQSKDEQKLLQEYFEKNKECEPKKLIEYIENIYDSQMFDILLTRFVNFCPMQIPNIKMIEPFSNRKYF